MQKSENKIKNSRWYIKLSVLGLGPKGYRLNSFSLSFFIFDFNRKFLKNKKTTKKIWELLEEFFKKQQTRQSPWFVHFYHF